MNLQNAQQLCELCSVFKKLTFAPGKHETYEAILLWAKKQGEATLVDKLKGFSEKLDDLEADFNRMCIGPYRLTVPPYESVWFGTRVMNTRRTEVVRWFYAQAGLVSNSQFFNEPADYFGYELEFIGFLACASRELSLSGNNASSQESLDWQIFSGRSTWDTGTRNISMPWLLILQWKSLRSGHLF